MLALAIPEFELIKFHIRQMLKKQKKWAPNWGPGCLVFCHFLMCSTSNSITCPRKNPTSRYCNFNFKCAEYTLLRLLFS